MAQSRKPKLSREATKLLENAGGVERAVWAEALGGQTQTHLIDEVLLVETYPARLLLMSDLANLRDADARVRFWRRWLGVIRPEWTDDLIALRDGLRSIWHSPEDPSMDRVLNEWLRWVPSHDHLAAYRKLNLAKVAQSPPIDYVPFHCSIKAGKLLPDTLNLRAVLIQGVLEHAPLMKICANPDCAAPYFIAKRRDQMLCDAGDCKAQRQREHARNWWNENRGKGAVQAKSAPHKPKKKGKPQNVAS